MKIVCLANSYKEGGRCIAGIQLSENNQPVFSNGLPVWIRPISRHVCGEIDTRLVSGIKIFDVLNIDVTGTPPVNDCQTENRYYNENTLRVMGSMPKLNFDLLCDNRSPVFGNRGKALRSDMIRTISHSLVLIKTVRFNVFERRYEDNPGNVQIRLKFLFNNINYDFPITDPEFLDKYKVNKNIFENVNTLYLVLSLGICWMNWHYKLVTTIIPH